MKRRLIDHRARPGRRRRRLRLVVVRRARRPTARWRSTAMSTCARWTSPSSTAAGSPMCWSTRATCEEGRGGREARHQPARRAGRRPQAQVAAQQAVVEKLHNGSRPEEIAQARANVDAASADAVNAKLSYDRLTKLQDSKGGSSSVTQSQLDAAKAAYDAATAKLTVARQSLALAVAGPRPEDIGQAEAQLRASQAQLALLKQQLKDADLTAPIDGIVRSRLLEPGEIDYAAAPGLLDRRRRPEMGARLRLRAGPATDQARHGGDRLGRRCSAARASLAGSASSRRSPSSRRARSRRRNCAPASSTRCAFSSTIPTTSCASACRRPFIWTANGAVNDRREAGRRSSAATSSSASSARPARR